jgi:hypothetical protein
LEINGIVIKQSKKLSVLEEGFSIETNGGSMGIVDILVAVDWLVREWEWEW